MGVIADKLNDKLTEAVERVERQQAEMFMGLSEWQNGNRITGARSVTLDPAIFTPRIVASPGRLVGWSMYAEGGSLKVRLRDSRSAGDGDTVAAISLTADGSPSTHWFGPGGISFGEGLWLEKVAGTGTLIGAVWLGARD